MSEGDVTLSINGSVASVLFDRPEAHNAMTWRMYDQLAEICGVLQTHPDVRVATFRGVGGRAFVAGTDIEQFREFASGEDGITYEKTIESRMTQLGSLPFPTVAVVDGYAIGGGLVMAALCDFRIATPQASFGAPIARTLGNCLSSANTSLIMNGFGASRAKRMLMLAQTIAAAEACDCGFVHLISDPSELDAKVLELCERLVGNAPLTMMVAKETIRRVVAQGLPSNDDLVRVCYGSRDFKIGVEAFLEKKTPVWTGA